MVPRSMNNLTTAIMAFALLMSGAAMLHADPTPIETPAFISGGIGDEGRAELEAVQKNYNLKLVFAGEGGIFLDSIHVVVSDAAKNTVLTTDTEGPILLAQLKPGKYMVTAEAQDSTQKQTLTIRKNKQTYITLRFPIAE